MGYKADTKRQAKKISLLIPVYNEVHSLEKLLQLVESVDFCGLDKELVIVDDGSHDGTRDILVALEQHYRLNANGYSEESGLVGFQQELSVGTSARQAAAMAAESTLASYTTTRPTSIVETASPESPPTRASKTTYRIVFHTENMGKGAALRTAIDIATGDIIAIQDADLEYNPADYPPLIKLIVDGEADVVYGSRMSGDSANKDAFTGLHYMGNRLLTFLTNLLYKTHITDMETCYKAFRADVIKNVRIRSNRFDFEPEITAKVLKQNVRLKELPISYQGRAFHEGKKITWVDGLWAIRALIQFRFTN